MSENEHLGINLMERELSLEAMKEQGWRVENNGYNTFLRHQETRAVILLPLWINQLLTSARKAGFDSCQLQVRQAIGLTTP